MMFWRVPNKMEQRNELTGFYVSLQTILSNFTRNWQILQRASVVDCNVTQPWRQRTVDTWKKTFFLVITPALTKYSSGKSRWTSWAVRPNEPSGFRGRKDLEPCFGIGHNLSLICQWHLRTCINSSALKTSTWFQYTLESRLWPMRHF